MNEDRPNRSGRRSGIRSGTRGRRRTVTDRQIIDVFVGADAPVLTTGEVAEQIEIGERGTLKRLDALEDEDVLQSKTVGSGRVWWLAPDRHAATDADAEDPLFDLPTFSGPDPTDVSENVDEHLAKAIAGEGDDGDA